MRGALYGLAAMLLAASLVGCPKKHSSGARPRAIATVKPVNAEPGGTIGKENPCPIPSSRQQILAALYSIFYRAAQVSSRLRISGWEPMPLETAARYLLCDPDVRDVRRNRIRNAAIQLATATHLLDCRRARPARIDKFRRALAVLDVPNLLVDKLKERLACVDRSAPDMENAAGGIIDTETELVQFRRSCCPCVTACNIGPWGDVRVAEFRVEVNRNPQCIFQVIDPQCWDDVVPVNFDDTFVIDGPACVTLGSGQFPLCRTAATCDSKVGPPIPKSVAPSPTAPWCGLLSEKVLASAYHINTTLENVLKVRTTQTTPGTFALDYGLCESRAYTSCDDGCDCNGQNCNLQCTSDTCAVVRDCGAADIQAGSPGNAVLNGSKQLQFKAGLTPDLNAWAQLALKVMVEEVASATCRPPSCAGAPTAGCSMATGSQTGAQGSTDDEPTCTCPGPDDSCTLMEELSPKDQPALCPPTGGE